jgi:hypothetical protein
MPNSRSSPVAAVQIKVPAWGVPGVWFLSQLIEAKLGAVQCRWVGRSRSSPTSAGFIFGLLAAGGAAGADLLPPSRRFTISAAPTKMATAARYRTPAPVSADQTADQSPCPVPA